jgi:hypothetical protein
MAMAARLAGRGWKGVASIMTCHGESHPFARVFYGSKQTPVFMALVLRPAEQLRELLPLVGKPGLDWSPEGFIARH